MPIRDTRPTKDQFLALPASHKRNHTAATFQQDGETHHFTRETAATFQAARRDRKKPAARIGGVPTSGRQTAEIKSEGIGADIGASQGARRKGR